MAAQSLGKTARHGEDKEGRWGVPGVALLVDASCWPLDETSRCVSCVSARELHAEYNRVEVGGREGAAPVVVRVQQQQEDMDMGRDGVSIDGHTLRRRAGEGVVARQDSHVADGYDDTQALFATIWQGESHDHVRVFEGWYAQWCGRANTVVKKSTARPFFPAHHQPYRSSVPV